MRGRKRRLKNFEKRAEAFSKLTAAEFWKPSRLETRQITRDDRLIQIGAGKHKRLTLKRKPWEYERARIDVPILNAYLHKNKIVPECYVLVHVGFSERTGVQEYFNKPSVNELLHFLSGGGRYLGKESYFNFKRFIKQPCNKGISYEKLNAACNEFAGHNSKATGYSMNNSNIIVLGQNRDGKIRLAIVD